ncbi:MAG: serine/threonine-protein kinase [Vulcanimicrobiota bacterium]
MEPGSTIQEGRIKLLSRLGLGGFGEVFLAQTRAGLKAVKVVDTSTWSKSEYQVFNAMLMNEASYLRTLEHPALPRSHDFFAEGPCYFIVMDWFQGQTLEQHVEREGVLSHDELFGLAGTLIELLIYLHLQCQGVIVFGDLKPANVVRTGPGLYRLVDLGLVSQKGTKFSKEIAVFSPKYGAPERGQGGASDPIHDIYSLGATVYFGITGKEPPAGLNEEQRTRQVAQALREESDWGRESLFCLAELLSLAMAALDPDPLGRPPGIRVFKESWEQCRAARAKDAAQQVSVDQILRHLYQKK